MSPTPSVSPKAGDPVVFEDGTTGYVKQYVRPKRVGDVMAHVVEMAKPTKHEYVTLITFLPTGFWQAVTTISTIEQRTVNAVREAVDCEWLPEPQWVPGRLVTAAFLFGLGVLVGAGVTWLTLR
jgi:hypothetical protein